jgi:hypothetical protein
LKVAGWKVESYFSCHRFAWQQGADSFSGFMKKPEMQDEARAPVGQGVDLVQTCDKARHQGIIEGSFHARDVDLGDVKVGHGCLL